MNIAIIPARSGSKRIKLKNTKKFLNKPIIFWTIKELKKSKLFDHIVTTSDSSQILSIAKKCGSNIISKRAKILSTDKTSTIKVIKSEIMKIKKKFKVKNLNICCVYPCNPLLLNIDLRKAFKKMINYRGKFIVAVSETKKIEKTFMLNRKKEIIISKANSKKINNNSNKMKKTYYENGQFCLANAEVWLKNKFIHKKAIGYEIPSWRSVDIDDLYDWKKAEIIFRILKK